MSHPSKTSDLIIGVLGTAFALVFLFIWIPVDIETGMLDEWRRSIRIGDAMLPTFAAIGMLLASIGVGVQALFKQTGLPSVRAGGFPYVFVVAAIMAVSLVLIFYTGPLLVWLWFDESVTYRLMLNTAPWKYAGVLCGGTVLVFAYISFIEQRLHRRNLIVAAIATALIIMLYDLPFDTLLLPPNGDY